MLVDSTIVAPLPDGPCGSLLRTFGRTLPLDEFLQVDPLSLGLRKQGRAGLRREIADDDTALDISVVLDDDATIDSPDKEREDDNAAQQVVDEEEDRVADGRVGLRLLPFTSDTRRNT